MNLIDAIKTGKPYKRFKDTEWRENRHVPNFSANQRNQYNLTEPDLLADDWEVMPHEISLDSPAFDQHFDDAWEDATYKHHDNNFEFYTNLKTLLKERLGLS